MPKKLSLVFSLTSQAKIWNMVVDHDAQYLYLELRDEEAHHVSIAAYDLLQRKLLWDSLHLEEKWWVGLGSASGDWLLLHTYDDNENPERKSFFAVDVNTQKMVWQSNTLQVVGIISPYIYGYERVEGGKKYKQVSLETQEEQRLSVEQYSKKALQENKYIHQPFHYSEEDTYFSTVSLFVKQYLNCQVVHGCEYLEYERHIFISYYIREGKALANYLLVLDTEGQLLLHEKMDDHLSQIGMGTFMVVRSQLVFIKNKTELLSYAV